MLLSKVALVAFKSFFTRGGIGGFLRMSLVRLKCLTMRSSPGIRGVRKHKTVPESSALHTERRFLLLLERAWGLAGRGIPPENHERVTVLSQPLSMWYNNPNIGKQTSCHKVRDTTSLKRSPIMSMLAAKRLSRTGLGEATRFSGFQSGTSQE